MFVEQIIKQMPLERVHLANNLLRCRCPICGDSKKNKNLCRGYFVINDELWKSVYGCWNCGVKVPLIRFIREYGTSGNINDLESILKTNNDFDSTNIFKSIAKGLKEKSQFKDIIPVITEYKTKLEDFLTLRGLDGIDNDSLIEYTNDLNSVTGRGFNNVESIIINYYSKDNKLIGRNCRLINHSIKYFSDFIYGINKNDAIYNIQNLDEIKPVIAVEGELDALSIFNGIGMGSSNSWRKVDKLLARNVIVIFAFDSDWQTNEQVAIQRAECIKYCSVTPNRYVTNYTFDGNKDANELLVKYRTKGLSLELSRFIIFSKIVDDVFNKWRKLD